jgi:hypothetical protein
MENYGAMDRPQKCSCSQVFVEIISQDLEEKLHIKVPIKLGVPEELKFAKLFCADHHVLAISCNEFAISI